MLVRGAAGLAGLLLAVGFCGAESPAVVWPDEQPAANLVGTAFGPQPHSCWSEFFEPLPPRGPGGERWTSAAEYLIWKLKPGDLPIPVVTSSIFANPPISNTVGNLNQGDTIIIGGNRDLPWGAANGLRFMVGYGLTPENNLGIEASGLIFERRRDILTFDSTPNGRPLLAIPFHRANLGLEGESRFVVAFPGVFAGQIYYDASTQLWGGELNFVSNDHTGRGYAEGLRLDLLGGIRYLALNETLSFGSRSTTIAPGFITTFGFEQVNDIGVSVGHQDRFEADNRFWGPQVGVRADYAFGRFMITGTGKLALGVTQQLIGISGYSWLVRQPGAPIETLPGGFFASPTNAGRSVSNQFSVVPELGLTFGWQMNECVQVGIGYTFLYWTQVARPGNQLDRNLNTSYLPLAEFYGQTAQPRLPVARMSGSDFWAQGVNFSLEVRY